MKLRPKKLRVYPNPWGVHPHSATGVAKEPVDPSSVTIDHQGLPAGVCAADMHEHDATPGNAVGSAVCPLRTRVTQFLKHGDDLRSARQTTVRTYLGIGADDPKLAEKLAKADPITIPYSHYYKDCIRDGSLIAADKATADVAEVTFSDPKATMLAIEKTAIEAWNKYFDDVDGGAFAYFAKERADAAKAEELQAKATEAAAAPVAPVTKPVVREDAR